MCIVNGLGALSCINFLYFSQKRAAPEVEVVTPAKKQKVEAQENEKTPAKTKTKAENGSEQKKAKQNVSSTVIFKCSLSV